MDKIKALRKEDEDEQDEVEAVKKSHPQQAIKKQANRQGRFLALRQVQQ